MNIKDIVAKLTLEEKAGLCSGEDFWHTKAVERLGIPAMMVSDGPHGLRKQDLKAEHPSINKSIKAVCFPSACATACSFDRALLKEMGAALGEECQAEEVAVILGPGATMKRSPVCGRNFEYFSEDPYLSGQMAASHIQGVQSKHVGTSLKHYFANNQEQRRMSVSANMDERTMREIYLASFEGAVKVGKPWTVMCSYNRINGTYAAENEFALTQVLRDEWGFDGFVMSDWGAANDRVAGLKAGLELEMPSSGGVNDRKIVAAVQNGTLDETVLDRAVERILTVLFRYYDNKNGKPCDWEAHHELARKIEGESMVLLKNDGELLPLKKGGKYAFIGKFASQPRYQGGGSSFINSFKRTSALNAAAGLADITYAQGYDTTNDTVDEELLAQAVEAAKNAEVAVVFAGLPDPFESEGYDRAHINLPECQNRLIAEIAKVQKNLVVVLHHGSPVAMPWVGGMPAILTAYLGGQAVGAATVDVLFGDVNPSGRLAETFPMRLEDNPSYLNFPGEGANVDYREGIFVGYRYYDKRKMDVLFPFGHGLSYTQFEYSNLRLSSAKVKDSDTLSVTVTVKNTGKRKGKEVVQLYVTDCESTAVRPVRELKGFEKVKLEPGESKEVCFTLDKRAFAYWNTVIHDWHVESGAFLIQIGQSSRNILLEDTVEVESTVKIPVTYTVNSVVGDLVQCPNAQPELDELLNLYQDPSESQTGTELGEGTRAMRREMMKNMPLRAMISFSGGRVPEDKVLNLLNKLNHV